MTYEIPEGYKLVKKNWKDSKLGKEILGTRKIFLWLGLIHLAFAVTFKLCGNDFMPCDMALSIGLFGFWLVLLMLSF